jgi:phage terminase large subunit-like protein
MGSMRTANDIRYQHHIARAKAILQATIYENPYIPDHVKHGLTEKQAAWCIDESYESLFGGAAGGGKSVGLLCAALQYAQEPGYHAIILRRTFAQLSKADSIMFLAMEWLMGKAKWSESKHMFRFESGATLEFGHMEHEKAKFNFQGSAFQFVGFDELTQFQQSQYSYLGSRVRRPADSKIPLRRRNTSNPGGIGHEWVYKRFINPETRPKKVRFIPSKLNDNPNLDRASYEETLKDLDPVTRAQLLNGDWGAVEGGRFKREWLDNRYTRDGGNGEFIILPDERFRWFDQPIFMAIDPAASSSNVSDWTVAGTFCISPKARLIWLACDRVQLDIPDQVPFVQQLVMRWRPRIVGVEAVMSNRALAQLLQRSTTPVIPVRELSPKGNDKLVRATPAMALAGNGRLWLPAHDPTFPIDEVIGELVRFTGDDQKDANDDIVDCISYACELLPALAGASKGQVGVYSPSSGQIQRPVGSPPIGPRPNIPGVTIPQGRLPAPSISSRPPSLHVPR